MFEFGLDQTTLEAQSLPTVMSSYGGIAQPDSIDLQDSAFLAGVHQAQ